MVGFPLDVVDIIKTFKTERSSTFIYLYRYIAPHIMFVFLSFFSLLLLLLFTSYYIYNQKATCSTISLIEGYGRKVTCCF